MFQVLCKIKQWFVDSFVSSILYNSSCFDVLLSPRLRDTLLGFNHLFLNVAVSTDSRTKSCTERVGVGSRKSCNSSFKSLRLVIKLGIWSILLSESFQQIIKSSPNNDFWNKYQYLKNDVLWILKIQIMLCIIYCL